MQPQSANVVNLRAFFQHKMTRRMPRQPPQEPIPTPSESASALERLAYHLLMAVQAAQELS
jgi:hypothetical protein